MNGHGLDELIESGVSVHRELDAEGRPAPPATWWDLPPAALDELYERQLLTRELERLIDPQGQSATAKAVLARVAGM